MADENPRRAWMGLLAQAPAPQLDQLWRALGLTPEFTWLRQPEIGSVMLRGRAGGTGQAFNLGEMTVTRCALQLLDGPVGHGYVRGRSKAKAEQAALVDALMQTDQAAVIRDQLLDPIGASLADDRRQRAAKAAATKVELFTLARGESE